MARGITITPAIGVLDLQQLRSEVGRSFYAVINQLKTGSAINTDAVTAGMIAAGNAKTSTLADDSVTAAKIAAGNVKTSTLAADAVTAAKIAAGNAKTSTIAADAVTAAKILDGAIHAAGYFALEGCRVSPNGGTNKSTVTVGVGYIANGGAFLTVAAGSVAGAGVAALTKYLVVVNAAGTKAVRTSLTPQATTVVLASISNEAANGSINAGDIGNRARLVLARY